MASRRGIRKAGKSGGKSGKQSVVWMVLQITGRLIGHLKNVQLAYLRVGAELAKVRDEKLYLVLKHPDLEDYAAKRLDLSRVSLYRYLRIHAWVVKNRPEWLLPKPKGRIPDLTDITDAIRIEDVIENKRMEPSKRKTLEELKQKALDGNLSDGEAGRAIRRGNKGDDSLKTFTVNLRTLRRRGAKLTNMPPEVLSLLDSAIGILANENAVAVAGLHLMTVPFAPARASLA